MDKCKYMLYSNSCWNCPYHLHDTDGTDTWDVCTNPEFTEGAEEVEDKWGEYDE